MKLLEKLGEAAREAGEVEEEKRASGRAEHEARAAVLRTALELAKPALPAILTRTRFFAEEQYVAMIGVRERKGTLISHDCRWQLYVTLSGVLIESTHAWQGGAWMLTGIRVIDVGHAADLYVPEDVAARLLRHCVAAAEGRNKRRTDEALQRASRFNALAALLESIGGAP